MSPNVSALLASEIIVLLLCFVSTCYLILPVAPEVYLLEDNGLGNIAIVIGSIIFGLYFQDMYNRLTAYNRTLLAQQICTALGGAFIIQSLVNTFSPATMLPRWVMLTGSLLSLVCLLMLRTAFTSLLLSDQGFERILFLGRGSTVRAIAKRIGEHPEFGLRVAGYLDESGGDVAVLGGLAQLNRVVDQVRPDRIVIGMNAAALPLAELLNLKLRIPIEEARSTFESTHNRVSLADFQPAHLDLPSWEARQAFFPRLQTLYSWFIALALFLLLLPILMAIALLVRASTGGSALVRQRCAGWRGQPFTLLRFRTENSAGQRTMLGRWLRRFQFDALPRLWNVLCGDMNLTGPRPDCVEFLPSIIQHIPFYEQRLAVKPGITGWAQMHRFNHPGVTMDVATGFEYDLYYLKHRNLTIDLYILLQTVKLTITRTSFTSDYLA